MKSRMDDFLEQLLITERPQGSDSEDDSSSSGDVTSIHEKIISAFSKIILASFIPDVILQLWTPITTIDGRRLLSTDDQPFSLGRHDNKGLHNYRLRSVEYLYNIDLNYKQQQQQLDINEQVNPMIINGAPAASAFLNRLPLYVVIDQRRPLTSYALECGLTNSCMLPVCCPSQNSSCCIGVVECSIVAPSWIPTSEIPKLVNKALQEVGLSICQVQERIPYQIIGGLKPTRDQIEEVLKIVCESYNIPLAQVWIPFENHSQTKDKFTIKLTGYWFKEDYFERFNWRHKYYYDTCDMFPLKIGEDIVGMTFQDYKPRFCKLWNDMPPFFSYPRCSRLVICLRSTNTGEFDYVFEFVWLYDDNYIILLKALLLALKKHLPSFKVASGAELDDGFHVIDFENSTTSEIQFQEILQSPISAYMKSLQQQLSEEKQMVDNYVAPSETICLTTPNLLPREVNQQPFGNTMKEATKNRNGAELVEEFNVMDVQNTKTSEVAFVGISSPISSYMNCLQQPVKEIQTVDNYVAPSETTCTTTLSLLPRERQFGNTIEDATQKSNEPGDELHVPDVENSTSQKILQENILLPVPDALERGKKPMVENYRAPSAMKYKTAPIMLSREAIEHQYGNTMKEAANTLNVSISTLKRKCKAFGISEWQGPTPAKRKVNDSSNQSRYINEEYDGAVQDPSAINKDENTLTIKAEYADDMIKFHLGISEATFITVEEEIGKKFRLNHGTYKLKYLDEDKDWILLASDQDMSDCMKSLRNLGRIVVRLRVLPFTQPISG